MEGAGWRRRSDRAEWGEGGVCEAGGGVLRWAGGEFVGGLIGARRCIEELVINGLLAGMGQLELEELM